MGYSHMSFLFKKKPDQIGQPTDFVHEVGVGPTATQAEVEAATLKAQKTSAKKKEKERVAIGTPVEFTHETHARFDPSSPSGFVVCDCSSYASSI